ncbi:hypothetical protein ACLOJK_040270 [Asimina triloba]
MAETEYQASKSSRASDASCRYIHQRSDLTENDPIQSWDVMQTSHWAPLAAFRASRLQHGGLPCKADFRRESFQWFNGSKAEVVRNLRPETRCFLLKSCFDGRGKL